MSDKEKNTADVAVDKDEYELAKEEAQSSDLVYVHEFKKPFEYQGAVYDSLTFDWGSLTGGDGLAIELEMQTLGKAVIVPQFSGEYLIRMAARACTVNIGADAFELMSLSDYNKIRAKGRSFLLKSEL